MGKGQKYVQIVMKLGWKDLFAYFSFCTFYWETTTSSVASDPLEGLMSFDGEYFQQIFGVIMGTNAPPILANIYMAKNLLKEESNKQENNFASLV